MGSPSPAPWEFVRHGVHDFEVQAADGTQVAIVRGSTKERVRVIDGESDRRETVEVANAVGFPNAALVTCAPGFLAALRQAEGALAIKASHRENEQRIYQRALDAVRAEIARYERRASGAYEEPAPALTPEPEPPSLFDAVGGVP